MTTPIKVEMLTVQQVIDKLNQLPKEALVYAYEGADTGIVICSNDGAQTELGFIETPYD